jgi:hypothetical protein
VRHKATELRGRARVEKIREAIRAKPDTAKNVASRTQIPYTATCKALNALRVMGEARWVARWTDRYSYVRVWMLTD